MIETVALTETGKIFTTREAIVYLEQKLGKDIKIDTFYHWVHRGILRPIDREDRHLFKFTREELDGLDLRTYQKLTEKQPLPTAIVSSTDMERLVQEHGEIVDSYEAAKIVRAKAPGVSNETVLFHLRNRVGAVGMVGHGGKRAKIYYFPLEKVKKFAETYRFVVKPPRSRKKAG